MQSKWLVFIISVIVLIIFSCEEQALNPLNARNAGEGLQQTGMLTMPVGAENIVPGIKDDGSDFYTPDCIILPELPDWPTAAFVIEQPEIQGDIITFTLSYSGGCRLHDFQLVCTTLQGSKEPQVLSQLFHNNNDDPCESWITEVRKYNLSPLKKRFFQISDSPCGAIIINLVDAISQDFKLIYQFCQDDIIVSPRTP